MLLLIDNYDSFTHNLARYFIELGEEVKVVRNDAISI
ncbi:MAG: glutamine amidotransferase-related protein, partial [Glaciecola sp.]